jgi:hypothetical protein
LVSTNEDLILNLLLQLARGFFMIFKTFSLLLFSSLTFLLTSCGSSQETVVVRIVGKAVLVRGDKTTLLHEKEKLLSKDRIKTYSSSIVIIKIGKIETEVQSEAELVIADGGNKKDIRLLRGSAWTKVQKLSSTESLLFSTPISIAGIRGTTFYTFQIGDMWGTCHCQGDVDYETPGNHYNARHHQDSVGYFPWKQNSRDRQRRAQGQVRFHSLSLQIT